MHIDVLQTNIHKNNVSDGLLYFRIFEDDVDEPEVDEPPPHPASDNARVASKADL